MNTNEITNAQMKANRFGAWAEARKMHRTITNALTTGKAVIVATYTKATKFSKPEHAAMFKATKVGCYMAQGKNWVCINHCAIQISN